MKAMTARHHWAQVALLGVTHALIGLYKPRVRLAHMAGFEPAPHLRGSLRPFRRRRAYLPFLLHVYFGLSRMSRLGGVDLQLTFLG
jgi:hypothetical protein